MKFIFARHGESTSNTEKIIANRDDTHGLTEKGIRQAEDLAARLSNGKILQVYSSPLRRAHQTGFIVADKLGISMSIEEALREFDCGNLEGRSDKESWASFIDLFQAWLRGERKDEAMAGGESIQDISNRFSPFIDKLINEMKGKEGSLLLVSHGGVLYTMLPLILSNISYEYASATLIGNTDVVVAEESNSSLICREWCGQQVKDE